MLNYSFFFQLNNTYGWIHIKHLHENTDVLPFSKRPLLNFLFFIYSTMSDDDDKPPAPPVRLTSNR